MNLISEYLETVRKINTVQKTAYDDRKNIKRHNRLADKLCEIATGIDTEHPELKPEFYQLLFHENDSVRIWCAHHILERMTYTDTQIRKEALKEISRVASRKDRFNALGNEMWLRQWMKDHPEDQELLAE